MCKKYAEHISRLSNILSNIFHRSRKILTIFKICKQMPVPLILFKLTFYYSISNLDVFSFSK